ncbi:MAG TPA: HAD family hydrolase [Stellaceae bacterium]|nr:HAD family hydrolase [Stellaceae bacterium]
MQFKALATDFDGTLAADGIVADATLAALERLRRSGRKLILVTGRRLDDLAQVFARMELFDRIIAENGALLHDPASGASEVLAEPPPPALAAFLAARNASPLGVGRVVVATVEPYDRDLREAIATLGLDWQVIMNKGSAMALPVGVDKATGVRAAMRALALAPREVVAVGDAENDSVFLRACGLGVAVANALALLKAEADWVTEGACGVGVVELAERLVASDLADLDRRRGPR